MIRATASRRKASDGMIPCDVPVGRTEDAFAKVVQGIDVFKLRRRLQRRIGLSTAGAVELPTCVPPRLLPFGFQLVERA